MAIRTSFFSLLTSLSPLAVGRLLVELAGPNPKTPLGNGRFRSYRDPLPPIRAYSNEYRS